MKKLILTIGISNSGKTYWAEEFCRVNSDYVNLNRDDIRIAEFCKDGRIASYKFSKAKEKQVTTVQENMAEYALQSEGFNIIVSDTNLNPKTRDKWKQWASDNNCEYEEKVFTVEPHVCIKRSFKRDYTVPAHVINAQYVQLRKYLGLPTTYEFIEGLPNTIVVDLDGTVADMTGVRTPFEWMKVELDKPHQDIIELVYDLARGCNFVTFLSGRDGICIGETREWIKRYMPYMPCEWELYQRAIGDDRYDAIIKEELFDKWLRGSANVKYVIDDRQQVCDRWSAMGLRILQVAQNNF